MEELSIKNKLLYKANIEEVFSKEFISTLPNKTKNLEIYYNKDSKLLKLDYIKKC